MIVNWRAAVQDCNDSAGGGESPAAHLQSRQAAVAPPQVTFSYGGCVVPWWPWLLATGIALTMAPAAAQDPVQVVPGTISGMRAYLRNALGTLRAGDLAALSALPDSSLTWSPPGSQQSLAAVFHQALTGPIVLVRQGLSMDTLDIPRLTPPLRHGLAATIDSAYSILLSSLDGLSDDVLYSQMFRISRPEREPYHFYAQSVPAWQVFLRAIGWGLQSRGALRGYVALRGVSLPRWQLP